MSNHVKITGNEKDLTEWLSYSTPEEQNAVMEKMSTETRRQLLSFMKASHLESNNAIDDITSDEEKSRARQELNSKIAALSADEIGQLLDTFNNDVPIVEKAPEAELINPEKMREILGKALFFQVDDGNTEKLTDDFNKNRKEIYNTGSWSNLEKLLEHQGKSGREKNIAFDTVIGNLYRFENPSDEENIPPYSRVSSGIA